ncbi:MAG TPA: sigma-70 family RNA polymerase sigma factor [Opitutaceae bacterium]|nr:sigma-70 family RNA polymerase sigma factor [Opitutaceae bacterium]
MNRFDRPSGDAFNPHSGSSSDAGRGARIRRPFHVDSLTHHLPPRPRISLTPASSSAADARPSPDGLKKSADPRTLRQNASVLPFDAHDQQQHRTWISRVANGDLDALRHLHETFSPLLFGVARRILSDPEDVREVVQDTFIKAWRQAAHYRPERGEVYSWLIFITRNQAIDRLRRTSRRHVMLTALENGEQDLPKDLSPDEVLDRRDLIDRNLAHLSDAQRRALELAFFTGCSQAEIAAAMRTPIGNVKNHLRRGLLKLRQLVERHD